VVIPLK